MADCKYFPFGINKFILDQIFYGRRRFKFVENGDVVDKPFSATAQDRESMSFLRLRREDSSNNSNQ